MTTVSLKPDHEWLSGRVPPSFWSDCGNQKRFIAWLAEKHRVKELSDWYKVSGQEFPERLIRLYGCYQNIVKSHFPKVEWHEWLFLKAPPNFWRTPANRRRYVEWLGKRLRFNKQRDWYAISGDDFRLNGGNGLLVGYYDGSCHRAVMEVFPEWKWNEWEFSSAPDGFWKSLGNRKRYSDWLGSRVGFSSVEDWHGLNWEILRDNNGLGLLKCVGAVIGIVKMRYPNEDIKEWLFASVPKGFWSKKRNRRRYFDWLCKKLNYRCKDDWYRITAEDFRSNSGSGLLQLRYRNSVAAALKEIFPEVDFCEWLLGQVPQRFWGDTRNCRRYFDWLGSRLGFKKQEDWYSITVNTFKENYGWGVLQQFRSSPSEALIRVYSEKQWDRFAFATKPNGFWENKDNQREFMDELSRKRKHKSLEDFYQLSWEEVSSTGGAGLLNIFGGSHTKAVMCCYPEHDWLEWKFNKVPPGFWSDDKNVRRYLRWLGKHCGYKSREDWYATTTKSFADNYGYGLLALRFNGSPTTAVKYLFPAGKWYEWKFAFCPNGFWHDPENRRRYLVWLGRELGIKRYEDWYDVTQDKLEKRYGAGLLDFCNGSQAKAIVEAFPRYRWDVEKFSYMRMNQKRIFRILKDKYRDAIWQFKHPELRFSATGRKMELDIWIPSISTAVEYQGQQHFFAVKAWGGADALAKGKMRDEEKRKACRKYAIRLIEIPYTWDGSSELVLKNVEPV